MLIDFEEEVAHVLVPIGHSLQPLEFIVDALGDGRSNPHLKVV